MAQGAGRGSAGVNQAAPAPWEPWPGWTRNREQQLLLMDEEGGINPCLLNPRLCYALGASTWDHLPGQGQALAQSKRRVCDPSQQCCPTGAPWEGSQDPQVLLEPPVWAPLCSRAFPQHHPTVALPREVQGNPSKPCALLCPRAPPPQVVFLLATCSSPSPKVSLLSLHCGMSCPRCCVFHLCPAGISLSPEGVLGCWGIVLTLHREQEAEGHVCSSWPCVQQGRAALGLSAPSAPPHTVGILSTGISLCALLLISSGSVVYAHFL